MGVIVKREFLIIGLGCGLIMGGLYAKPSGLKLNNIKYAGNGCPGGSVSVGMAPNKRWINAVFDSFAVHLKGGPQTRRKNCELSMTLNVPNNKRARLKQVRFRAFLDLPKKSSVSMTRSYQFGRDRLPVRHRWSGANRKVIEMREPFNTSWSKCGERINMRVRTSVELKTKNNEASEVGVDSFNHYNRRDYRGERGWRFMLDYAPC